MPASPGPGTGHPRTAPSDETVLLLLSPDADTVSWCRIAEEFTRTVFARVDVCYWERGEPFPAVVENWEGDWILSFRGDLIVPERIYSRARRGAINIHPSPPWFRGLGGAFYALDENHARFGSTCHHMARSVDAGTVIDVRYFTICPAETMTTLRHHVGAVSLAQYLELVSEYVAPGLDLPVSPDGWGERLHTSSELAVWIEQKKAAEPGHRCFR